jgi:hypothetical protein
VITEAGHFLQEDAGLAEAIVGFCDKSDRPHNADRLVTGIDKLLY